MGFFSNIIHDSIDKSESSTGSQSKIDRSVVKNNIPESPSSPLVASHVSHDATSSSVDKGEAVDDVISKKQTTTFSTSKKTSADDKARSRPSIAKVDKQSLHSSSLDKVKPTYPFQSNDENNTRSSTSEQQSSEPKSGKKQTFSRTKKLPKTDPHKNSSDNTGDSNIGSQEISKHSQYENTSFQQQVNEVSNKEQSRNINSKNSSLIDSIKKSQMVDKINHPKSNEKVENKSDSKDKFTGVEINKNEASINTHKPQQLTQQENDREQNIGIEAIPKTEQQKEPVSAEYLLQKAIASVPQDSSYTEYRQPNSQNLGNSLATNNQNIKTPIVKIGQVNVIVEGPTISQKRVRESSIDTSSRAFLRSL